MMDKKILNAMFENLLHIGNKKNHWNPKMKEYIYADTNGVHVFNLVKTVEKIEWVKAQLKELTASGKQVLFVATKLQARDAFAELAVNTGNFYVNEKWVPGLLTNFKTIKARITAYITLLKESSNWSFDVLTKKEKAAKMLELEKLDRAFKWVKDMKRLPDVIFVVDGAYEVQALKEANNLGIKTFALANTNTDPDLLTDFIPANTNSVKSIAYVAKELASVAKVTWGAWRTGATRKVIQKKPLIKKETTEKKGVEAEKPKVEVKTEEK